ncbi:hypothetical protein [Brachybacterium hainanense]|uniref:Uncharacterized protein n=1 Tax=Brachybacterium hainanense TaxID=1541174 RepID=A0ABV6RJ74_9MICO
MICNWYVDESGADHRLRTAAGWGELVLGPQTPLPHDAVLDLGTVQVPHLRSAIRWLRDVVAGPGPEGATEPLHLVLSHDVLSPGSSGGQDDVLVLSTMHGDGAAFAVLGAEPAAGISALPLTFRSDELADLEGLTGRGMLRLGADEDWTATLVVDGGADSPRRQRLARTAPPSLPVDALRGRAHAQTRLPRNQLAAGLDGLPGDADLTIAMVPGRVLVRTETGLLQAIEAETRGAAIQTTIRAGSLRRALGPMPSAGGNLELALIGTPEHADVRLLTPRSDAGAAVTARGWRYR